MPYLAFLETGVLRQPSPSPELFLNSRVGFFSPVLMVVVTHFTFVLVRSF